MILCHLFFFGFLLASLFFLALRQAGKEGKRQAVNSPRTLPLETTTGVPQAEERVGVGGQRRRQMPEKEQRKEREREEKTEYRVRKLLEERRRAPGGRALGGGAPPLQPSRSGLLMTGRGGSRRGRRGKHCSR